jgi:integrase
MKKIKFPYTVRVGSATAKIYHTPNKGRASYTVGFYNADGSRQRRMFTSFETAKDEAESLLRALLQGAGAARVMSDLDRLIYDRAADYIRPLAIPLDHAAREYAEAIKLLEGTSDTLLEAVRHYRQFNSSPKCQITAREAFDELLEDRTVNNASPIHIRGIRGHLGKFTQAFQCRLDSITPNEIEDYLKSFNNSPRTIKNHRTTISMLFNFAKINGYLPQSHPGVRPGPRTLTAEREINLFTPQEMKTLLNAANPRVLPAMAIGAFAGVRSEEVCQLGWSDIKLDRGFIEVRAKIAKKRVRRLAPLLDNLREWLIPHRQESGLVLTYRNYPNELGKVSKAAGVPWRSNGLRKTFISCRVAETEDIPKTALEAGNSPEVIHSTYLEAVDKATAEAWFNIRPGDSA